MEAIAPVLGVLIGAAAIFVAAVWFGRRLAPRVERAADRLAIDEEEPGDRPD